MWAPGHANLPAVRLRMRKTVRFGSTTVQKPEPQRRGEPNPNPCLSTRRTWFIWLHPSISISGSVFRVFLFMVTFGYPTANRKILTFAKHCPFQMNRPPLSLKTRETRSLPHPGHKSQWRVNDFWSCIMSNQGGYWMQTIINEVLATFQSKRESDMLPAPFWKWTSTEH